MKGFNTLKIVQLVAVILTAVVSLVVIVSDDALFQMIGSEPHVRSICILLWISIGISLLFLLLDLWTDSRLRRENEELNYAIHTDSDTGLANRKQCDSYISRYQGMELPEDLAAVTVELVNLKEINNQWGYAAGDEAIRDLAGILQSILPGGGFLGRNGSDRFLMILEHCEEEGSEAIVRWIQDAVSHRSQSAGLDPEIRCSIGCALQKEQNAESISALVAASDHIAAQQR